MNTEAKGVLDVRLAKGEISIEEYGRIIDVLRGGPVDLFKHQGSNVAPLVSEEEPPPIPLPVASNCQATAPVSASGPAAVNGPVGVHGWFKAVCVQRTVIEPVIACLFGLFAFLPLPLAVGERDVWWDITIPLFTTACYFAAAVIGIRSGRRLWNLNGSIRSAVSSVAIVTGLTMVADWLHNEIFYWLQPGWEMSIVLAARLAIGLGVVLYLLLSPRVRASFADAASRPAPIIAAATVVVPSTQTALPQPATVPLPRVHCQGSLKTGQVGSVQNRPL